MRITAPIGCLTSSNGVDTTILVRIELQALLSRDQVGDDRRDPDPDLRLLGAPVGRRSRRERAGESSPCLSDDEFVDDDGSRQSIGFATEACGTTTLDDESDVSFAAAAAVVLVSPLRAARLDESHGDEQSDGVAVRT